MIDFNKYRWITAFISFALMSSFFGFAFYKRQTTGSVFRYSVDFTGGAQVLLKFSPEVTSSQVKDVLDKHGWQDAILREFGPGEILVRIQLDEVQKDLATISERMQKDLQDDLDNTQVTVLQSEAVGPGVGKELTNNSIKAVLLGMLLMLCYIALRFWSFGYAAGAVIALFHDAVFMLATFLFFNREISINVIGAILAVIGYSINDTIVIFSQIRDNLKKRSREPLAQVVNSSINQTLRRTMLTSISTGLTVLSMLLLGGEALRDFALALMVGVVVGTYSSVFIASPVMMMFNRGRKA